MNYLKIASLACILLIFGVKLDAQENPSVKLDTIIQSYQEHEGYDRQEYPLGLDTKEYNKAEAEFAQSKLEELSLINTEGLNETELISFELLKFELTRPN